VSVNPDLFEGTPPEMRAAVRAEAEAALWDAGGWRVRGSAGGGRPGICHGLPCSQEDASVSEQRVSVGSHGAAPLRPARPSPPEFFKDCIAAPEVELKVGAQVLLLKNQQATRKLVNGSR
jgi:hypothetical protein